MNFESRDNEDLFSLNLSGDDILSLTSEVPVAIARDLGFGIDSEKFYPPARGKFPRQWCYKMRCVESCPTAMNWVKNCFSLLGKGRNQNQRKILYLNLVRIVAVSSLAHDCCPAGFGDEFDKEIETKNINAISKSLALPSL